MNDSVMIYEILKVWVYRLSVIEQATSAPGREELREHALESSKGKYRYIHPSLEFQVANFSKTFETL